MSGARGLPLTVYLGCLKEREGTPTFPEHSSECLGDNALRAPNDFKFSQ